MRKRSISQRLKGLWSEKHTSKSAIASRSDAAPYLPVEILSVIIEYLLQPIFLRNIEEGDDDIASALQNLKQLSVVSRSFHAAVITACSSLASSTFLPNSERVISTTFEPVRDGYLMLYEPILPLYALARLLYLDFSPPTSNSSGKGDDESTTPTITKATKTIEVKFKKWDPISLRTLLLVWDRQAQHSINNIPKSNISLKIEGADNPQGFPDDVVLQTAFPRLKNLEFERIYIRLPVASLPIRTARMLEGRMPRKVKKCKVDEWSGEVCAYYWF